MPSSFVRSRVAVNAEADAVCALLDGGFLDIYDGNQPASADRAAKGTRLVRLPFRTPAFARAADGTARSFSMTSEDGATATGEASWFRAVTPDGTAVFDGSVGTEDADLILSAVEIYEGAQVSVASLAYVAMRG